MQDNGQYRGIRLASGQDLVSPRLVLDPSFVVPPQVGSSVEEPVKILSQKDVEAKVARGICVTGSSLMPDVSNLLVVYPPRCKLFRVLLFCVPSIQIKHEFDFCQGIC